MRTIKIVLSYVSWQSHEHLFTPYLAKVIRLCIFLFIFSTLV